MVPLVNKWIQRIIKPIVEEQLVEIQEKLQDIDNNILQLQTQIELQKDVTSDVEQKLKDITTALKGVYELTSGIINVGKR